jgi:hypothetical protein
MTRRPTRSLRAITAALAVTLLVGCSSGPPLEGRIAAAIEAMDTATAFLASAHALLLSLNPDLDLRYDPDDIGYVRWSACSDEAYTDHYDGPDSSLWHDGIVTVLEPRRPTIDLIAPLAEALVADGWIPGTEPLDRTADSRTLTRDGFRLVIDGLDQDHLDQFPEADARFRIVVYSPCLYSPDNLTEWDPEHPHDFDLAPPEDP